MQNKFFSSRQLWIWIPLVIILGLSIFIIIYINNQIVSTVKFRDQVITDKYEGSLSENLGFLTMLTAEISNQLDLESDEEKEKIKEIKKYLLDLKSKIEKLQPPQTSIPINANSNIEAKEEETRLISWLHPETISQITFKNLNLEVNKPKNHSKRPYLHSFEKYGIDNKSFVLIPTPLVPVENGRIKLTTTVKREVVFSKIIEKDLLKAINGLESEDLWQVYFIPISGLARISKKEKKNLIGYYKNLFPGLVCFSDRPYFKKTMADEKNVRTSKLYIDSAANGIIITYSVFIRNEKLDIIGMIGVDRKIKLLSKFFEKVKLGAAISKDFQFKIHPIVKKGCGHCHKGKYGDQFDYKYMWKNFEKEALSLAIAEVMENPNISFKKDIIKRMDFPGRGSTIYLVRTSTEEVACFHFNPGYAKRKNRYLVFYFILPLLGIIVLMVLAFSFFLSKVRTQRIHTEVVSHLNGGLIIVDGRGNIKFHNQKMAELLEVPTSKLNGKNFLSNYLSDQSKVEYEEFIQKSKEGFEFAGRITRADETPLPAIISSAAINHPGIANAQMLIIIPSEQLESEIAANFIHGFSHALKTPIQSILLLADRLRRKKIPQPKFDRYFSLMEREVDEFTNMVTNLLKFSKLEVEGIRLSKKNHNLAALFKNAVKPFKEKAKKANIHLKENIPERLTADIDKSMMRVILNNLLENALKYTNEGEIRANAYEEGHEVVISVSDTGIGIPVDERENIFDKFFRGRDQAVRVKDGIGIGLYISIKYARLHGGTLTYEPNIKLEISEKGKETEIEKGSKFILRIPKE